MKPWMRRAASLVQVCLALWLTVSIHANADLLPRSGTFDGVYHRDRWGVGHFNHLIVHPDLHAKLAPFEGRRIKLVVKEADQPFNPGAGIIVAIGEITPLPEPPLRVEVSVVPHDVAEGKPFQLVIRLKNSGKQPIDMRPDWVMVTVRCPVKIDKPEEPSFLTKAYTQGQISVGHAVRVQLTQALVWAADRERGNLARSTSVSIPSGDSFPMAVMLDQGLPSGKYEVEATAFLPDREQGKSVDCPCWLNLDVPAAAPQAPDGAQGILKLTESSVAPAEDESYELRMKLVPAEGKKVRYAGAEPGVWAGRICAFAEDGTAIPLDAEHLRKPWDDTVAGRMMEVPEGGVELRARFHTTSRFCDRPIKRLAVGVLADTGVETFALAGELKDVHFAEPPPFGEVVAGVKLRARPAKAAFKEGEPLRFRLQAVNVSGKPVVWITGSEKSPAEKVAILVDGKAVKGLGAPAAFNGGWAGAWLCQQPYERTVTLPQEFRLAKGTHSFSYAVISKGGTYRNANNEPVPYLKGKLVSNEVRFIVE